MESVIGVGGHSSSPTPRPGGSRSMDGFGPLTEPGGTTTALPRWEKCPSANWSGDTDRTPFFVPAASTTPSSRPCDSQGNGENSILMSSPSYLSSVLNPPYRPRKGTSYRRMKSGPGSEQRRGISRAQVLPAQSNRLEAGNTRPVNPSLEKNVSR